MIEVKDLLKRYGKNEIIKKMSFTILDGDFVAITGESGSGKTTILNLISLLDGEYTGEITIDGKKSFTAKEIQQMQRQNFGYLFQNYALIDNETVKQNLRIALKFQKNRNEQACMRDALSLVDLHEIEDKKIYELSGGEQQRVALARAYLKKPKYIFADEPTGNLDSKNRDIVFAVLKKMNDMGVTVVMVTHDKELVKRAVRIIEV